MATKRSSVRIAAKKEEELAKYGPELTKIRKKFQKYTKEPGKLWSASEKERLLDALRKHGTADIPRLQRDAVPHRSEAAVKAFVDREKVKMTQVYREVILPDGRMKVLTEPRQMDAPIEQWIEIVESKEKKRRADVGYIVPKMLEWISEYEQHPDPKECDGIDYAAIYKSLAMLMQGEVPPQLNVASSKRMLQLFAMLQTKVRENAENVKAEVDYMSASSSRIHRATSSTNTADKNEFSFQRPSLINIPQDGYDFDKFLEMPGVNPLDLPHAMFSKQLFERQSTKPVATVKKPATIDMI